MTLNSALKIVPYRPAHRADWQALNAAWLAAGGFTVEAKDRKAIDDPEGAILAIGGHIFIAERDGAAVGCCALLPMADGGREVAKMTVAPEARGLGLARRLLEACEAQARTVGAHRLYLETSSTLAPARALYDRFGFTPLPPAPSPYVRCDVWMEKRL
ncbi:MAG: putative acetyltransferase [Brevundimonas sp.]|jgi:putative acetyltransferase|uniref:GNAT family N-acetyltransferase n=1 Tax=Brevundimonas sp. TaxID=1871086 RepID=UPI00248826FB|nr:GNAT family N-acetyltransferase [Brevundimonas sp.]MDI1281661.1 GNAT family N-acetyltransferase [Brevundimonas sp.]